MMRRAALSRADLLRALALAGPDEAAQQRVAAGLGYEARPEQAQRGKLLGEGLGGDGGGAGVDHQLKPDPDLAPAITPPQGPLQATLWGISHMVQTPPAEPRRHPADSPDAADAPASPLQPQDCLPRHRTGAPPMPPLVRLARLRPALRRSVGTQAQAGLDVPRLVKQLSQARLPDHLPRRQRAAQPAALWLLVDVGDAMAPYARDGQQLLTELAAQSTLHITWVSDVPQQVLGHDLWLPGWPEPKTLQRPPAPPPAGARVLLLSHLGALAPNPRVRQAWLGQVAQLRRRGAQPLAWVPHSRRWLHAALAAALPVHCLDPHGDLRASPRPPGAALHAQHTTHAPDAARAQGLPHLLTLVACCAHLGPDLLRHLRLLAPEPRPAAGHAADDSADHATLQALQALVRAEPGLEGLLWAHQPVVSGAPSSRPLSDAHAPAYRQRFAALPVGTQQAVVQAMRHFHAWEGQSIEATEALLVDAHAHPALRERPVVADATSQARRWFRALEQSALQGTAAGQRPGAVAADVAAFAHDLLQRQGRDAQWLAQHSDVLAPLWCASGASELPQGLSAAEAQRAQAKANSRMTPCQVLQVGDELWLWPDDLHPTPEPRHASSIVLPGILMRGVLVAQGPQGRPGRPGRLGRQRWVGAERHPVKLCSLSDAAWPITLTWGQLGDWQVTLSPMRRPAWAPEWGRDAWGLYALAHSPWDEAYKLYQQAMVEGPGFVQAGTHLFDQADRGSQGALGADAVGLYADITVKQITQRFRWIEPGSFWMGSPHDEPERQGREGPRHQVTMTEGFWLADTACTQALWLAVMGSNPSHFRGKSSADLERPVESLHWHDVRVFMAKLKALLPGVQALLPTEAQWEYACRAGTDTPFSFGENISPAQVNYDGTEPYRGAPRGEYRGQTVPVKSLPANAWGMYEMHGNVWEWCADGPREYSGEAAVSPLGAGVELNSQTQDKTDAEPWESGQRAIRGGSWSCGAWGARSAYHDAYDTDFAGVDFGFRLALTPRGRPRANANTGTKKR